MNGKIKFHKATGPAFNEGEVWVGGKDSKIMPDDPYCSIRDIELLKTHGAIMLFYGKGKLVKVT